MPAPLDPKEQTRRIRLGGRIKEYRLLAGLTLDELASRVAAPGALSFNRRHVEKWETGKAPLSDDLLRRIGAALGVDAWDFSCLSEAVLPLGSSIVAKSTDGPVDRYEMQVGHGVMKQAVRALVERLYASRRGRRFTPPVVFKPSSALEPRSIEAMADKIRHRWELGTAPIADVVQTIEERQVTVIVKTAPNMSPRVLAGAYGGWPVVFWSGPTSDTTVEQQHFRLRILSAALRTMALMRGLSANDAEDQAGRVARAVLLPANRIGFHFGGRISVTAENVLALSSRYGLPADMTVRRMVETGAVPAHVGELLMQSLGVTEIAHHREKPLGASILPPPM